LRELRARAAELEVLLAPLPLGERLSGLRLAVGGIIVFTTSFGLEDQLILHELGRRQLGVDVVTLDTGRLFTETYELWTQSERRYGMRICAFYPQHEALESVVAAHGVNGFYRSLEARLACCRVRKTEPLARALAGAAAWITGLRAEQSAARRDVALVGVDAERGLLKFNPLFDWTREAVLHRVRECDVPISPLHERGFASIGCAPCTRAIGPQEPERAGRWWWEAGGNKECGLHGRGRARGVGEQSEKIS
jgi:phosphoadenosine phosphosulfate reductase